MARWCKPKVAQLVKAVVDMDSTPEMMDQGRQQPRSAELTNLQKERGNAQHLPYSDDFFDLVTSLLGMHHFFDPLVEAKEMALPTGRTGGYYLYCFCGG